MIIFIINIILLPLYLLFLVNEDPADKVIIEKLTNYSWTYPQEKVYLHINKSFFVPGEDVWFKAYLMMGPYQVPDTISGVLYVELINMDETIIDRKILHMREGLGWGDFHLPRTIDPGKYMLKAYTRYMQNFDPAFHYRKWIHVVMDPSYEISRQKNRLDNQAKAEENTNNKPINLQFFPEGGNIVAGLHNYIAFKSTNEKGRGKQVNGIIKNAQGKEITTFESKKFGMGLFSFIPEQDGAYVASIEYEGQEYLYTLPEPAKEGYTMHINRKGDNVYVWVRNNMGIDMDNTFIIGQFRGFPFINIHAEPGKNYLYSIFNIREIPTGIIQLTFFDSLGVPQCERLVYTENKMYQVNLSVESDKDKYRKREKVEFSLHSEDNSGNYPLTNLSLSIVNNDIVKKDDKKSHIRSYFSLEADLKGFIEDPGYYFNPDNEDRLELLDILLLTHGWRRFVWKEILDGQYPEISYPLEPGFNITGKVVDFFNKSRPRTGTVRLFIYEGQFYYNEIDTDENGLFAFLGINIYDSTHVVMQAWEADEESKKPTRKKPPEIRNRLGVRLNEFPYAAISPEYWMDLEEDESQDYADFYDLNDLILKIDSSYGQRTILLDELTIKDTKIVSDDPFERSGKLYKNPTRRIVMDSIPVTEQSLLLFQLIRKYYPNVNYTGVPPDIQVSIRGARSISGNNQAMLLLDGVEVTSDFLYYFPATEVAFIDVLSSTRAAVYGGNAMNGAIAIYTRNEPSPFQEEGEDWILNFLHPGYYRAREFYAPNYGVPEEAHIRPDYRRTLYWNPSLTTDDLGNIKFSFYTSDEVAEYRVEIEGMTYNGIPITKKYYFSVE